MRLRLNELVDGSNLIFCGIEFQIVGAANLKDLRPTALAVKGTCNRLSESVNFSLSLSYISSDYHPIVLSS